MIGVLSINLTQGLVHTLSVINMLLCLFDPVCVLHDQNKLMQDLLALTNLAILFLACPIS